jgi:WD40 repeat protein
MMRKSTATFLMLSLGAWISSVLTCANVRAELPLQVNELKRTEPVDFGKEILPIIKRNCLACHNTKTPEGGLVLETLASIQKGGDGGPSVVAKDAATSLLMTRVTGVEEPLMPPEDNPVGAKPLTPDELGLIKLWIEQGATGKDEVTESPISWQSIPDTIRSVYSLDIAPDGQYAAIGRANKVAIVDLASNNEIARLVDPSLKLGEVADVDLVQSIAFSPDGQWIATGGFRSVRLWKKSPSAPATSLLAKAVGLAAVRQDETLVAMVNAIGDVEVWDVAKNSRLHVFSNQTSSVASIAWADQANRVVIAQERGRISVWDIATGKLLVETETNAVLREVDVTADGSHLIARTSAGSVQLFRMVSENETVSLTKVHESLGGVTDATAIELISLPSMMAVIARGAGGVAIVEPNENKVVRSIDHGAVVVSLAVSSDETKLATGGRDGVTHLWNVADGSKIQSMESTPDDRLLLARSQRDANRQKNLVARLTAKAGELTEALKKENEALTKVTETRDKAKEAVAAEVKKHTDAMALVATTQAQLEKAKADSVKASEMLPVATKAMEVAMAESVTYQKEVEALEKQLAEKKTALATAVATVEKSKAEIEAANKLAAESKAMTDKATTDLEQQTKAATEAAASKDKSETELKNRQQALDASTVAVQQATAAIPAHQAVIDAETRVASVTDAELVSTQSLARQPDDEVIDVAFNRDGSRVATIHRDGSTRVYRSSDGLPTHAFQASSKDDARVTFFQNDLCRTSGSNPTAVYSMNIQWTLHRVLGGIDAGVFVDRVTALQFRRDSQAIAVGGGSPSRSGDVKVFAVESGELLRDFGDVHSDTVLGLDFNPNGNIIASAGADRTIQLLDITTGKLIRTLEGHTHHVLAISWHSDGEVLASASADLSIKIWNTSSGEVTRTITGFPKELTSIQYVPESNQIVVACANGQVRLADASNGNAVRNFDAAGDFLYTVRLTPDAQTVLSGGQSGTVRKWKLADGALVSELK